MLLYKKKVDIHKNIQTRIFTETFQDIFKLRRNNIMFNSMFKVVFEGVSNSSIILLTIIRIISKLISIIFIKYGHMFEKEY